MKLQTQSTFIPYVTGALAAMVLVVACGKTSGSSGSTQVKTSDAKAEMAQILKTVNDAYPSYHASDAQNVVLAKRIEGQSATVTLIDAASMKYDVNVSVMVTDETGAGRTVSGHSQLSFGESTTEVAAAGSAAALKVMDKGVETTSATDNRLSLSASCRNVDCSQLVVLLREADGEQVRQAALYFVKQAKGDKMVSRWTSNAAVNKSASTRKRSFEEAKANRINNGGKVLERTTEDVPVDDSTKGSMDI